MRDVYNAVFVMYKVLKNEGIMLKVRHGTFEECDILYTHIAGIDTFALELKIARCILDDEIFEKFIEERYFKWRENSFMKSNS